MYIFPFMEKNNNTLLQIEKLFYTDSQLYSKT